MKPALRGGVLRTGVSIVTVLGLIAALWGSVLLTDAESARQSEYASPAAASVPVQEIETDAARRARLEGRIAEWSRTGPKPVLKDSVSAVAVATRTAPARAQRQNTAIESNPAEAAPPPRRLPTVSSVSDTSTIAPPPTTSAFVRSAGARGYRPPRLDLANMPRIPTDPVECLTQAIYYEARNESEEGQSAVAEVVINRSQAGNYPRDICKVVYQRNSRTCQFTFTCDGSIGRGAINMTAWSRAERIAREVHSGRSGLLPKTSVNYHANYVRPSWGRRLERVRQIGAHIFYGSPKSGHVTPGSLVRPAQQPTGGLQFVRIEALDRAFSQATSGTPGTSTPPSQDVAVND